MRLRLAYVMVVIVDRRLHQYHCLPFDAFRLSLVPTIGYGLESVIIMYFLLYHFLSQWQQPRAHRPEVTRTVAAVQ